jgi:hypothetical protein
MDPAKSRVKFGWLLLGLAYGVVVGALSGFIVWEYYESPPLGGAVVAVSTWIGVLAGAIADALSRKGPRWGHWIVFFYTSLFFVLFFLFLAPAMNAARE